MAEFKSYATPGKFRAPDIPDLSKNILKSGQEVIDILEAIKAADIKRRSDYLAALQDKQEKEKANRDKNYALYKSNRQTYQQSVLNNYKTKADNARTEGQNQARIYQSISDFSTTAQDILYKQAQKEYKRQFDDEYTRVLTEGLRPDDIGQTAAEADLAIEGERQEQRADFAASLGASESQVENIRGLNGARAKARQKAKVDLAASGFASFLAQSYFDDDKTKVEIIDPTTGQTRTVTPVEAQSTRIRGQVSRQLLLKYLKDKGIYGMDSKFIADGLLKMQTAIEEDLRILRISEVSRAKTNRVLESRSNLIADISNLTNWITAFQDYDRAGVNKKDLIRDILLARDPNGRGFIVGNKDINNLLGIPVPGTKGTIGSVYGGYITELRAQRVSIVNGELQAQNTQDSLIQKAQLEEVKNFILTPGNFTTGNLNAAIEKLIETGNVDGAKELQGLKGLTIDARAWDIKQKEWDSLKARGLLTKNEVLTDRSVPVDKRNAYAQQMEQEGYKGITKPSQSRLDTIAKDKVRSITKTNFDLPVTTDANLAQFAMQDFLKDTVKKLLEDDASLSEADAITEATRLLQEQIAPGKTFEVQYLDADGEWFKEETKGGSAHFINFYSPDALDNSDALSLKQVFIDAQKSPDYFKTKKVFDEGDLEALHSDLDAGVIADLEIPEDIERFVLASGGKYSTLQIIQDQFEAYDLKPPVALQGLLEDMDALTQKVSPELMERMNSWPTREKSMRTMLEAGIVDPNQYLNQNIDANGEYTDIGPDGLTDAQRLAVNEQQIKEGDEVGGEAFNWDNPELLTPEVQKLMQ